MLFEKIKDIIKQLPIVVKALISSVLFLGSLCIVLGFLVLQKSTEQPIVEKQTISTEQTSAEMYFIDIKGAINKPGVYSALPNERVKDIVDRAGGFTDEADTQTVNLAAKLNDMMLIVVPKKGESSVTSQMADGKMVDGKVNINHANKQQLMQLDGVGDKKAQAIIDYRQMHGAFKTIDELQKVKGFSKNLVEKLEPYISV